MGNDEPDFPTYPTFNVKMAHEYLGDVPKLKSPLAPFARRLTAIEDALIVLLEVAEVGALEADLRARLRSAREGLGAER
jgi:hypothetical protein